MRRAIFCLLSLFIFQASLHSETVLIVTDSNLAPFCYEENGVAKGIDVDMMKEAARRMKIDIIIEARPWKRALKDIESGEKVAGGMSLFRTPEREKFAYFTGPVHYSRISVFVKSDKIFKFSGVSDLYGKTVGINRGFVISEEFDVAVKTGKIKVEEVNSTEQNIQKLMTGRIDCFCANSINTLYLRRDSKFRGRIVELEKPVAESKAAYFVFSKAAVTDNSKWMIQKMKETLESLHREGVYRKIVSRYIE